MKKKQNPVGGGRAGRRRRSTQERMVPEPAVPANMPPDETRRVGDDITERRRVEQVYSFLACTPGASPTEDFFRTLARYLAQTFAADYVCIDRLIEERLRAQTVAVYFDGEFEDNVAYALQDTPCGEVVGRDVCCFPSGVRGLFPQDAVLQDMKAEGHAGVTLWSHKSEPIALHPRTQDSSLVSRL